MFSSERYKIKKEIFLSKELRYYIIQQEGNEGLEMPIWAVYMQNSNVREVEENRKLLINCNGSVKKSKLFSCKMS